MADSLLIPGRPRPQPTAPAPEGVTPEQERIARFALALTRSVGEADPYFADGANDGRMTCFFCGELAGNPHLPLCGHVVAKRLVETGKLDDAA